MPSKWSLLTFTALTIASLFGLASIAQAQNGYRGYIGPYSDVYANAPYASVYRNASPGLISLGEEYLTGKKGREIADSAGEYLNKSPKARHLVSEAEDYATSPKGRRNIRQAKNYIEGPKASQAMDAASVFLSTPSPLRDELLDEVSSGSNFDFLAGAAIGYLRTGQVDLVGDKLTVNQGGRLGAQVYDVRTMSTGRVEIDLPDGNTAIGQLEANGSGATMKLMTHGVAVPVVVTNYIPSITKYPNE